MERNKVTILKRRGGEGDEMVECGEQGKQRWCWLGGWPIEGVREKWRT